MTRQEVAKRLVELGEPTASAYCEAEQAIREQTHRDAYEADKGEVLTFDEPTLDSWAKRYSVTAMASRGQHFLGVGPIDCLVIRTLTGGCTDQAAYDLHQILNPPKSSKEDSA